MTTTVDFQVNGKPVSVAPLDEETPLLDVLRNELGLMGTRFGCGLEQCGCCMVLIDGAPEKCCAKPVWSVAGKQVTTVEGLGNAEAPHPLQQAFLDEQAGQCGYCLSGILISAKALLDANPKPTRAEIAAALDGNICRCGTHVRILRAVEKAAADNARGGFPMNAPVTHAPARLSRIQSATRSLDWLSRARPGHGADRPRRTRPGRADRHGADRGRRTGRRSRAHHRALRRYRRDAERGLHLRQPFDPGRRHRHAPGLRRHPRAVSCAGRRGARLQCRCAVGARRKHPARRRLDRAGLLVAGRRGRPHRQGDRRRPAQGGRRLHRASARAAPGSICRARFSARPCSFTTCGSTAWCMPASFASQTAAPPSAPSTRPPSAAPPRDRSNSCVRGIFSPSSAATRPRSNAPAARRRRT